MTFGVDTFFSHSFYLEESYLEVRRFNRDGIGQRLTQRWLRRVHTIVDCLMKITEDVQLKMFPTHSSFALTVEAFHEMVFTLRRRGTCILTTAAAKVQAGSTG